MIKNFEFKKSYNCKDLENIVAILRAPGGCPWDAEQTHESIKTNFIEETYEAVEAINKQSPEMLREELGDVLLQIMLHSQMEAEKGIFNFDDICDEICKKLILRHPHVFGDVSVNSTEDVLTNWDAIKMASKKQSNVTESMLSVPREFPALMRSQKIQHKAAKVGFDWQNADGALQKVKEETAEVEAALINGNEAEILDEIGDLFFSVVNVARFAKVDSEQALTHATDKFLARFEVVEKLAKQKNIDMKTASIDLLDELWDEAKKQTNAF